jgi:hypothetical protein
MNSGIKKKTRKESIEVGVVLLCVAAFMFYLLFLSNAVGLKVVAQIETTNDYVKRMDSLHNVTESTKNAVLEALVKRDEENKALKQHNLQVQAQLNQALTEAGQLEKKLKRNDAKLILCSLIWSFYLPGCAAEQSSSNTLNRKAYDPEKDEIVSRAIMKLVQKDLEHYGILKLENLKLKTALDSVKENCTRTMEEMRIYFSGLDKENKELS